MFHKIISRRIPTRPKLTWFDYIPNNINQIISVYLRPIDTFIFIAIIKHKNLTMVSPFQRYNGEIVMLYNENNVLWYETETEKTIIHVFDDLRCRLLCVL